MSRALRAVVLAASLAVGPNTLASDLGDFHAALGEAWPFYRSAMFYLRTGNAMVAGFELDQMRERWQALRERYASRPPDAYADDARFAAVLGDVDSRIGGALERTAAGDAEGASAVLAPVRTELAAMRARAGVRTFSDCVDEVDAAMEALYVYRRSPPDLAERDQVNDMKSRAAVLGYLLRRCDGEATEPMRADPEFRRIVDGALAAVAQLFATADRGDRTGVVNVLRELHSFDRILFLRFG